MEGDDEIALTPADEAVLKGETPEPPAAAETPAAAPEKAQETPPETKPTDEPEEKLVPLQALREARASNKELKLQQQRLEERFSDLQRMMAPKPAETKPAVPDWDANPLSAGKHDRETAAQRDDRLARLEQRFQAEDQQKQIRAYVEGHEAEFRKATPDYDAAIQHVVNGRAQELALLGADPSQIAMMLQQEAQSIARAAAHQGKNPAEVMYGIAQQRGYRKAETAPAQATAQPAQAAIAAINRGQAAAPSVAQAGGSPSEGLTVERVANMSMDDIAAIDDKTWRKLFA